MQRSTATLIIIVLFILIIACVAVLIFRPSAAPEPAVTAVQPQASPASPAPTTTPPLPTTASDQIIDLFQPSGDALKQQLNTSDLTNQIENAMVVSYTLMYCNLMTQQEYADTFNALIAHSVRSHLAPDAVSAEARVRSIASAAAGSYSMVYSRTPCDDESLPEKATALKNWRDAVLTQGAPSR